jgi:hypothetical protein
MMGFLASSAVEAAETHFTTPYPPATYGLGALVVFGLLLLITFAFRSVGNRH